MDDDLDEAAAAHGQVHGWSSYSLSLPSEPPDIRNWFSSYEYESPEVPELDDLRCYNGSETQDPLELISPRDDGLAVRQNRLGGQSKNELLDRKDLVTVNESIFEKPPKRKQSLRALFSFLDKHEETTESECQVVLPVQRNAVEPLPICNATGLLNAERNKEGAIERGKVPVDCNSISSLDTQISSPDDEVTCIGSSLADNQKSFPKDGTDSTVVCEGISSVETQVSSPADQELEYSKLPVICVSSSLAGVQKSIPEDSTDMMEHSKVPVDSDGISSVDTQVSSPDDQEVEYIKRRVTCDISGMVDIQKFIQEDGIDSYEKPINFVGTNLMETPKGSRGGAEHRTLPVCHDSTILAGTRENSAVDGISRHKPALDNKGQEQAVSSDGFIAIKRKHRPPEECKKNSIPKYPRGTNKQPLQENHNVLGHKDLAQVHTRSPLADRTNFPEAAAAPKAEIRGKWKCPTKGKPQVGPPMKQLRLEPWLRPRPPH